MNKFNLDTERLAILVRRKRFRRGLRETAKEIVDVSPSTISRVENGKVPDMKTFLALCDWLKVSPASLIKTPVELINEENRLSTPEAIINELRADKNLDPAVSTVLESLVKAAYTNY